MSIQAQRPRGSGPVRAAVALLLLLPICTVPAAREAAAEDQVRNSERHRFQVHTLVEGLEHPWSMAFLPGGDLLVTERIGRLRLVRDGKLEPAPVQGLPQAAATGQGGVMDVALGPKFGSEHRVYLSLTVRGKDGLGTEVIRGRLRGKAPQLRLEEVQTLFRALPKSGGGRHFGSRLLFTPDGNLFITLGDRGQRPWAQDLDKHPGSMIRLGADGTVPPGNPFFAGALPEIYSYGHRNVQGICRDAATGTIWTHEHGPQGGDELNPLRPGINYGWPEITYGVNYVVGTRIGRGSRAPSMEQPVHYWVPSIAPSGLACYNGDAFPEWRGNLFVGSLKFSQLVRLELRDGRVVHEERMLDGVLGRIRDVRQGPDGLLYLLSDERRGRLVRLEPVAAP